MAKSYLYGGYFSFVSTIYKLIKDPIISAVNYITTNDN